MSIEESKKGGGKKGGKRGVDNTSRRTWDTEEFEKKAKARAAQVPRPLFQAHNFAESFVGSWLDNEGFSQDEQDDEESALDAKRRRRWGKLVELHALKHRSQHDVC